MVTIPRRFNGPEHSANGGWVSGLIAGAHRQVHTDPAPVTVTLRRPPPLETPLAWERDATSTRLTTHGGALLGEAADGAFAREAPAPADLAEAERGEAAYLGFGLHPFAHCFVCGTARAEGDGLRLFTGPTSSGRTAGVWRVQPDHCTDDGQAAIEMSWAGLDCPGGWAADFTQRVMLLGRMTGQVLRAPRAGEVVCAVGELDQVERRKFLTATALWSTEGELLGRAEQIWIEIDPSAVAT